MQSLIAEARAGNTKLREVLTNQKLLRPNPIEEKHLFHRSEPTFARLHKQRSTIAIGIGERM